MILARLRGDSGGNTLAIMAAAMVPIMAMIGSGLDMARAYMAHARLQTACDAAALAARRSMDGAAFSDETRIEGQRFFDFNFPAGTMDAQNLAFDIGPGSGAAGTISVQASADIPTTVMALFGNEAIAITAQCGANQGQGHADVMLVLDVTGSMNDAPSAGGDTKIERLRAAASSLYQALEDGVDGRTRFGIMPYSMTVNVGGSLRNRDILATTHYHKRFLWTWRLVGVPIDDTGWEGGSDLQDIGMWRTSGAACIEERSDIGSSSNPPFVSTSVSRDDIDAVALSDIDTDRQWGRYDPVEQMGERRSACPDAAVRLRTFAAESDFRTAVSNATQSVSGNTYHDIGLVWGARFLSRTGMFAADNGPTHEGIPVSTHIVFLTDGIMDTDNRAYSAYGIARRAKRIAGATSLDSRHRDRFQSACARAKAMGMTIWVIALDVTDTDDIRPCATSDGHFFVSDGSDLDEVFADIGQGIGRLRLTE